MPKTKEFGKGRVTLPGESGMDKEIVMLMEKWGADAIRDSDGTQLSSEIMNMGYEIYTTLCLVRADQDWTKSHKEHLQQKYLMSTPHTATSDELEIDVMQGYFKEQFQIDTSHNPEKWWEVIDRTTGEMVDASCWDFIADSGKVVIRKVKKWHVYTVSFLVHQIWDSTSMYNHIVNKWKGEHIMSVDPRQPETRRHLIDFLDKWLKEHPNTDVVRLTSIAYHFTLIFNDKLKRKYRDWHGYHDCVSPLALEEFAKVKGYHLRPEDLVDEGYYNTPTRIPSKRYLDWIDFQQKFVIDFSKECVEHIHNAGKKAIMFLGDHWIGTEPYSLRFQEMNLDGIVGACMDGVEARLTADIPGKLFKELRLYPYFFSVDLKGEPVFLPGGDPAGESQKFWLKIRRALLRKNVDRIGFGGYLSLAVKFPDFLEHLAELCEEFRQMHHYAKKTLPYSAPFKVAILNAWGKLRSWQNSEFQNGGLMECLSGMCFDLEFISFDDIEKKGIPDDVGVIINTGDADSSWSGGKYWTNEKVISTIREWVYNGGGFIGVGEPTAHEYQGRFFQLADLLGVQKEIGFSRGFFKHSLPITEKHFIMEEQAQPLDFGYTMNSVYASSPQIEILAGENGNILLSAHLFGKGRSIYMADFKYSLENTRLLLRAIYWAASKEENLKQWFSSNLKTECAAYPETGYFIVINNDSEKQETLVYNAEFKTMKVELVPLKSKWFRIEDITGSNK